MKLSDINPFMRYAELQPSAVTSAPLSCAYDYRIFYIIEGEAKLILEDGELALHPGMLVYFRPGMPYYFDGKVKIIVLNFDMTRSNSDKTKSRKPSKDLASFMPELIFENDPPKELDHLIAIENAFEAEWKIQTCLYHYSYPSVISDACTSALIKDVLCYIVQNENAETCASDEIVRKISLYIKENYDKSITNSDISAELGYHSFYLNRVFKKQTGTTIHKAVLSEKMSVAKRLLSESTLSVKAIADEVGFFDDSQFCTVFKKHVGCSAKEYRRKKSAAIKIKTK